MNTTSKHNIFLVTTGIALICSSVLLYTYRNDIMDAYLGITEGEEMVRLINISAAIKKLKQNLADIEVILLETPVSKLNPSDRKKLVILLADVDYIYEQLDMITGNQTIKKKRKELILEMKAFSEQTDLLAKQL